MESGKLAVFQVDRSILKRARDQAQSSAKLHLVGVSPPMMDLAAIRKRETTFPSATQLSFENTVKPVIGFNEISGAEAYPRERGGTLNIATAETVRAGLSPRTRGNLV